MAADRRCRRRAVCAADVGDDLRLLGARRAWRGERPTDPFPEAVEAADDLARVDLRQLLLAALAELPRRQRATVVLRYYCDLSESETAQALGCSVGTVKSQAAKGLARLRRSPLAAALEGIVG